LISDIQSRFEDNRIMRQVMLVLLALGLGIAGGLAIVAGNPLVPFVAVIALVALPWLVTRPMFDVLLVVGTVMLLPFAALPVRLAVFTPTLLEAGLALLYVAWLLRALVNTNEGLERTPLDVWLLVFLGSTLFAFVLGLARDASSDVLHNYIKLLLSIGIFYAASNLLRTSATVEMVLRAVILTGGVEAIIGVILWRLPAATTTNILLRLSPIGYPTDRVVRYVEDNPALPERAVGTQVDPNSFGGLLVVLTILTGVALLARRPILPRWLLGGLFLFDAAALVLTDSRAALVGVVAGAALVATLRYRRLWGWGLAGAALILVLGLGSGYFARLASGFRFEDPASLMRLAEYSNALDIIGRYPAFGVGFGTAGELDLTTGVSSVYLTIAERAGLFSLGLFLVVVGVFFANTIPALVTSIRNAPPRGSPGEAEWSVLDTALLGGTSAVLAALLVGLVDHYYFNIEFPHMAALLWLTMALALVARRLLQGVEGRRPTTD
jgi:hypothetical protein